MTKDRAPEDSEEKYRWMILFQKHGKIYPYMYRTVEEMTEILQRHRAKSGKYPYRIWAVVENDHDSEFEMLKVEITVSEDKKES